MKFTRKKVEKKKEEVSEIKKVIPPKIEEVDQEELIKEVAKESVKEEVIENVVAIKPVVAEEIVKEKKYIAITDISLEIRKGDIVPEAKVELWKKMGIYTHLLVKEI